jgi:two-component system OmpR family sensor kinase
MLPKLSIRARLALWYGGVFAVSLGAVAVGLYGVVARRSLANVDAALHEATSAVATALEIEAEDQRITPKLVQRVVREFRFNDLQIAVYDRAAHTLMAGEAPAGDDEIPIDTIARGIAAQRFQLHVPGLDRFLEGASVTRPTYANVAAEDEGEGGAVRAIALPRKFGNRTVVVGAVHGLAAHRRLLQELRLSFGLGIPLLLALSTVGGYMLARKSLKPVSVMTERAARISVSTLHERLPVARSGDELARLATVFNDLLSRLGAAFDQQRQFIADASHELRTPVAIVRGEAELALSRDDRSTEELRTALRTIGEEMQGLQSIVEDLFLLARANAGERLLSPAELYLGELCAECVRAVRSLAAQKDMQVTYEGGDELPLRGDETLLRRLLLNLLDNAIKYTERGGRVILSARAEKGTYVVDVQDTGAGIPEEARRRVFDRFYRALRSRNAGEPLSGAGLGLAIARSIAVAHGGDLTLERSDANGSLFRFTVPSPPTTPSPQVDALPVPIAAQVG